MKKFALLIILTLFIGFNASTQSCLPEGIIIYLQEQIDNFQTDYPGCTEIEGGVSIYGFYITGLNGLSVLNSIGGDLDIWETDYLTDLSGLDNLTLIGGSLKIGASYGNDALISLSGLEHLSHIGGDLIINSNSLLKDISGLQNLETVGGNVSIGLNDILTSLSGLEKLNSVEKSLWIYYNDLLTNLLGINNIISIGENLAISANHKLINLTGIEKVTSIGGNLQIIGNRPLAGLSALGNLTTLEGELIIAENDSLVSLSGLENLNPGLISKIKITDNGKLSTCSILSICEFLKLPYGNITIDNNASGCDSQIEIMEGCGFFTACLPDGITFESQADIDNFKVNHPGCTEIFGNVLIDGSDISNLDSLNEVTAIYGELAIGEYFAQTFLLENLEGLINLTTVAGNLRVHRTKILKDLHGLDNLTFIGGDLEVYFNQSLENLHGLEGLTTIYGSVRIGSTGGNSNQSLSSLAGLNNITTIGGDLSVETNAILTNLTGLDKLTSIGGGLDVQNCDTLASFSGLESLTSIGGTLQVSYTTGFSSLTGLQNLTSIGGNLIFMYNNDLVNLSGLNGLTTIGGAVQFRGNPGMINLTGIENVTSIGGVIWIYDNNAMTSLTGLENILPNSIQGLNVDGNDLLSSCEAKSVCDYLADSTGEIQIFDNAPGCNSPEEVDSACKASAVDEFYLSDRLSISPNPFVGLTTIQFTLRDAVFVNLEILDVTGRKIKTLQSGFLNPGENQLIWDATAFKGGLYFLKIQTNRHTDVRKLLLLE